MELPDDWVAALWEAFPAGLPGTSLPPEQLGAMADALTGSASKEARVQAVEAVLEAGGPAWRDVIGGWVTHIVPVETLVPEAAARWRPLVRDAIQFLFSRLSGARLAAKLVEQLELPRETGPEARLLRLIAMMPGLQKIGQVLARNRRLAPALREALSELENGMRDVTPGEIRGIIAQQLGPQLEHFGVDLEDAIFSEASVSAVMRFTWRKPGRERERGVFKVLKPHVPGCFAEDMALLEQLGEFLASEDRGYGFAIRDVKEVLTEVRLLLEHELDFAREQHTLLEARRTYRSSFGIRVPRLIRPLCTARITAMSEESGVKVTEAFRRSPIRRRRIAEQLVEALLSVPLLSREEAAIFHADPHAGNLLYDEPNRELVVLDWALAEPISRESRRLLVLLALMMLLRNADGVCEAIQALGRQDSGRRKSREALIRGAVKRYFERLGGGRAGALDAMMLLDEIALEGVRFPAALFLFRKMLFTLDGVLADVAGPAVRVDRIIARDFLTRWVASLGLFHAPLAMKDLAAAPWSALRDPVRAWIKSLLSQEKPAAPGA